MKDIPGFENLYAITEDGRIWSYKRAKWMGYSKGKNGYVGVCLYTKSGDRKRYLVHRLVWITFVGVIADGMQINHKNCIRDDNRLENLEICTPRYNTNYNGAHEKTAAAHKGMKRSEESRRKMSEAAKKRMKQSLIRDSNGRFTKKVLA